MAKPLLVALAFVALTAVALPARADLLGSNDKEVSVFLVRVYDDVTEASPVWSGVGTRLGWRFFDPFTVEGEAWLAGSARTGNEAGGLVGLKANLGGPLLSFYGRGVAGHFRRNVLGGAIGLEGVFTRLIVRGEVLVLRGGDTDLGFSIGVGLRL